MGQLTLVAVLTALATHRLTRFVTRDQFPLMALPREAFVVRWSRIPIDPATSQADAALVRRHRNDTFKPKKDGTGSRQTNLLMHSLAYLWECDWCASVWVGALVTLGAWHWTVLGVYPVYISVLVWLSASTATGLIAQREPE